MASPPAWARAAEPPAIARRTADASTHRATASADNSACLRMEIMLPPLPSWLPVALLEFFAIPLRGNATDNTRILKKTGGKHPPVNTTAQTGSLLVRR